MAPPAAAPPRAGGLEVALTYARITMSAVGGGSMAWSWRIIVERKRWLTDTDYLAAHTLARILPGANSINLAVMVGTRVAGLAGAVGAFAGMLTAPFVLFLLAAQVYGQVKDNPWLHAAFTGLAAAGAGMAGAVGGRAVRAFLAKPLGLVFGGSAFVAVGVLHLPLPAVIAGLGPLSVLSFWPWRRRPPRGSG